MTSLATAIALLLLAVAIVWGGYLWSRRDGGGEHEEIDPEFLIGLGEGLGLDRFVRRDFFGETTQVLEGEFGDLQVELEVSDGRWPPYARLVVEFGRPLGRGVGIFSDDRSGVVGYVQRVREIEIGDEEFDDRFLLYASAPADVRKLLPEPIRAQMARLDEMVGEFRLTDETLFLFAPETVERDRVRRMLKKGLELCERLVRTARELGPRKPETSASHYERATLEQAVRLDESRTGSDSAGRTTDG